MSGDVVQAAVCCGGVVLALALGYFTGSRRRLPRHGTVQLRHHRHRRRR